LRETCALRSGMLRKNDAQGSKFSTAGL